MFEILLDVGVSWIDLEDSWLLREESILIGSKAWYDPVLSVGY
jgi:hypothetical protein